MSSRTRSGWALVPIFVVIAALAMALVSSSALAQEADTDQTTESPFAGRAEGLLDDLIEDGTITQEQADAIRDRLGDRMAFGRFGFKGLVGGRNLTLVAETLGLELDALRDLLVDGSTIAQVAEDQGVALDDITSSLIDAAQQHIDDLLADGVIDAERAQEMSDGLTEHIDDFVNGAVPFGDRGRGHGRDGLRPRGFGSFGELEELLGLDGAALGAALMNGQTLAEIAADQGVAVASVIDTLTAQANARIDEAVANGHLDADEATAKKAEVQERVTAMVNGEEPVGGAFGGHRRGSRGHSGGFGGAIHGAGAGLSA